MFEDEPSQVGATSLRVVLMVMVVMPRDQFQVGFDIGGIASTLPMRLSVDEQGYKQMQYDPRLVRKSGELTRMTILSKPCFIVGHSKVAFALDVVLVSHLD